MSAYSSFILTSLSVIFAFSSFTCFSFSSSRTLFSFDRKSTELRLAALCEGDADMLLRLADVDDEETEGDRPLCCEEDEAGDETSENEVPPLASALLLIRSCSACSSASCTRSRASSLEKTRMRFICCSMASPVSISSAFFFSRSWRSCVSDSEAKRDEEKCGCRR